MAGRPPLRPRPYRIEFSPAAERDFRGLPPDVQKQLRTRIDALAVTPRPFGVKKLEGDDGLYRLRIGVFRVIYQIHDRALLVLVLRVGHRKNIYRR